MAVKNALGEEAAMHDVPWDRCLIAVRGASGSRIGAGLLISERHLLTCAHVATKATDREQGAADLSVVIDFVGLTGQPSLQAKVLPPFESLELNGVDLIALELVGQIPDGAEPVPYSWFVPPERGHRIRVLGFPVNSGMNAYGQVGDQVPDGRIQISAVDGHRFEPGYSGAPAWNEESRRILGLMVMVAGGITQAFMITAQTIEHAYRALGLETRRLFPPVAGPMPSGCSLYTRREADDEVDRWLDQESQEPLAIRGPGKVGKTTLLNRIAAEARQRLGSGIAVAEISLSAPFVAATCRKPEHFFRCFFQELGASISLPDLTGDTKVWKPHRDFGTNAYYYMFDHVLEYRQQDRVLLIIDDTDRLFNCPSGIHLFKLLRTWHDDRSRGRKKRLKRLVVVFSYSTEPTAFLPDYLSPASFATRIPLNDFSSAELGRLADAHEGFGNRIKHHDRERLFSALGGHPYLSREAMRLVVLERRPVDEVLAIEGASRRRGHFVGHLNEIKSQLRDHPQLAKQFYLVATKGRQPTPEVLDQLCKLGLTVEHQGAAKVRNRLYAEVADEVKGSLRPSLLPWPR